MDLVPTFYLYGEPYRSSEADFVHVESLEERSRPSDWRIRPHAHRDLNHVILLRDGGGEMEIDGEAHRFTAPCLLLVPSQVVHGFVWADGTNGLVITFDDVVRTELLRRDPETSNLFDHAQSLPIETQAADAIARHAGSLMRELGWVAPAHRMATQTLLMAILVEATRARFATLEGATGPKGRQAGLVARFRELVEERFRQREPIGDFARRLAVSETTLRNACAQIAKASPGDILNQRAIVEARRALCYSDWTISQIAYSLGFNDPAYFTRLFTRMTGQSPRTYRQRNTAPRG